MGSFRTGTELSERGARHEDGQEINNDAASPMKKRRIDKPDNEEQQKNNINGVEEEAPIEEKEVQEDSTAPGFTVLEEFKPDKNSKVFRTLPAWLAKPSVISCDLVKNKLPLCELSGLDRPLLQALKNNKILDFFPVQQQVIPWLLKSQQHLVRPCDICVSAPTGSGKTLAFVLPTVQALLRQSVRRLRCLAVLPVHDLAVQVYRVYSSFCAGTNLQVALIAGQEAFHEEQKLLVRQTKTGQVVNKPDIVVCTPGRLVDHLQRTAGFSLKSLRFLIIDEADRIMDEDHNDWLFHVEKSISAPVEHLVAQSLSRPCERYVQKLLFSATLSQDPEKLSRLGLFQPKLFTSVVRADSLDNNESHHFVGKYTTPAELTEHFFQCDAALKPLAVYHLLKKFKYRPALCFTVSREATHRLCELLKKLGDINVVEFSTEISRQARDKLLQSFSQGKIDLLVCTDAVSRGMDLGVVDCVISYDTPKFVKNYIHRVGRTARAGRPGTAITIVTESEKYKFKKMLEMAEKKNVTSVEMTVDELEIYEEQFRTALESLKTLVDEEKQNMIMERDRARRKKKRPANRPKAKKQENSTTDSKVNSASEVTSSKAKRRGGKNRKKKPPTTK